MRAEMRPGSLIEEAVVMERLNARRAPLREALQRLVQDDLVRNVPRSVEFLTVLPMNATGKVVKDELRARARADERRN